MGIMLKLSQRIGASKFVLVYRSSDTDFRFARPSYQIVLFTTQYFKKDYIEYRNDPTIFRVPTVCREKYPRCLITRNSAHVAHASGYISHWRDFIETNMPLPPGSNENSTK